MDENLLKQIHRTLELILNELRFSSFLAVINSNPEAVKQAEKHFQEYEDSVKLAHIEQQFKSQEN
ncbi:hypothetical protein [Corynebacterium casei]|uniref:hypothetical protein n=1 Tax=Corynebacterium casei TaxID=160386 RepID=UPI003FD184D9